MCQRVYWSYTKFLIINPSVQYQLDFQLHAKLRPTSIIKQNMYKCRAFDNGGPRWWRAHIHRIETFCYALPFRGLRKMGIFRMSLTVLLVRYTLIHWLRRRNTWQTDDGNCTRCVFARAKIKAVSRVVVKRDITCSRDRRVSLSCTANFKIQRRTSLELALWIWIFLRSFFLNKFALAPSAFVCCYFQPVSPSGLDFKPVARAKRFCRTPGKGKNSWKGKWGSQKPERYLHQCFVRPKFW